jgi:hypothetical protein
MLLALSHLAPKIRTFLRLTLGKEVSGTDDVAELSQSGVATKLVGVGNVVGLISNLLYQSIVGNDDGLRSNQLSMLQRDQNIK